MARVGESTAVRLFTQMARARHFELALADLWRRGLISGEMHLGIGEEGAVVGVVDHVKDGDALALGHRSTPQLVARGTDVTALVLETLGSPDGLCHGMGGHMHLFDPERLVATSGIVGAAGPAACGFALSGVHLRPRSVAVAFFGEGAMNQGMMMESLNLASVWSLPVVFVCTDNGIAVTTRSRTVTAGGPVRRAASFGMPAARVDGSDVFAVWRAAGKAFARARAGRGPSFLCVRVRRPEGHFLGDPLVEMTRDPAGGRDMGPALLAALRQQPGATNLERARGLVALTASIVAGAGPAVLRRGDPLAKARRRVGRGQAARIEERARKEIERAVLEALAHVARTEAAWPA